MLQTATGGFIAASADVAQARASVHQRKLTMRCCRLYQALGSHTGLTISKITRFQSLQRCRPPHSTRSASVGTCGNVSDLAGGGSSLPQPQACNAGESSSTTPPRQPATQANSSDNPQSNGASVQSMAPSGEEVQQLRQDVSQLSRTVTAQAKALQEQMMALQQAHQLIDVKTAGTAFKPSSPSQHNGWNKDIKPFEIQRNAIGDRRYLGGYDARFHSTNM